MNDIEYRAVKRELGRRGGVRSGAARRQKRRELDKMWPPCGECGTRTHLNFCPKCDK